MAIAEKRLDHPNERSLHAAPIPRGGGLAFVLTSIAGSFVLAIALDIPFTHLAGLILPLSIFALTGWMDDKHNLNIAIRLAAQILAAVMAIMILGGLDRIQIATFTIHLGWLAWPVTLVWVVWMANLYNFMDGIDGIASVQGIVAATTMGIWYGIRSDMGLGLICFALAAGLGGFLYYNWPPAKIFMGDTGSLYLGGFFAIQTIIASTHFAIPLDAILILLGVFLMDTGITLLRRMIRKEKWWQAHRSHFYQRAAQSHLSHATVSLSVLFLSSVLAFFATMRVLDVGPAWIWIIISVILLTAAAVSVMYRESTCKTLLNG